MSSGCGDVLSLEDLKTAKKHQTFEAEVITGHAGGVSSGASIDYATNQVTGQIQKTLPAILRDMGFDPADFDFTTGGTVTERDTVVYNPADNNWYSWSGSLPHVVAPGTDPTADANWKPRTDQLLRQQLASTASGFGSDLVGHVSGGTVADYIGFVTPQSQGCPCNGVDDDTTQFNAMVQGHRSIKVPPGNYVLDINTINIPSNTSIEFHSNAVVTLKTQSVVGGANMTACLFKMVGTSGTPVSNVRISGGKFIAGDDSIVAVGIGSYVSDVEIFGIDCRGLRAVMVLDGTGQYASSTSATRAKNIRVKECVGTLSVTPVTVNAFTQFNYVENALVDHVVSSGYWFGGMGWGGNAAPSSDGAVGNERKCKQLTFRNCVAQVAEAGFWISMGQGCDITGCSTSTLVPANSDVGVDFEGCVQCNALSNNVEGFLNGNLATFYYCDQINFSKNKSTVRDAASRHGRLNNDGQNSSSREVSFSHNLFKTIGFVSAITQNGAAQNVKFVNNSFENTVVSLIANNNGVLKIHNNEFYFTVVPSSTFNSYSYFAAVALGAYHGFASGAAGGYIENNTFETTVAWPSNSGAILLVHVSSNVSTFAQIKGGGVLSTGFVNDIVALNNSTNVSFGPRFYVDDFRVFTESIVTTAGSAGNYAAGTFNAKDKFGRPWPTAPIAGAYMVVGQVFPLLAPTTTKRGTYVVTAGVGAAAVVVDYQ